jgi:hypothetical protein
MPERFHDAEFSGVASGVNEYVGWNGAKQRGLAAARLSQEYDGGFVFEVSKVV